MNRCEFNVLRHAIRSIAHHNEHLWWELKRQIWDGGYQPYYPRQSEYERSAQLAVSRLAPEALNQLCTTYSQRFPSEPRPDTDRVVGYYSSVVVEEIVRRAGVAAYRTENW